MTQTVDKIETNLWRLIILYYYTRLQITPDDVKNIVDETCRVKKQKVHQGRMRMMETRSYI